MIDFVNPRPSGKPLRIACVGGGYHSAVGRTHNTALRMDGRFEVVAGCFSLRPDENQLSGQAFGVSPERLYASLEVLLTAEVGQVDAVAILTPTDQHHTQVQQCLGMGYPVICEKALATSSVDVEVLEELVRKQNGFLAVIFNYLGYPMLRELRAMIQAGDLGAIKQIQIEMPQEGFLRLGPNGLPMVPQKWRLTDPAVPMISLDLGVHIHSIISFLTERTPESVVALAGTFGNFNEIVDNVSCLAKYSGGLQCVIWFSKVAVGHRNGLRVRVFGDKGAAEWVQERPEYIEFATHSGQKSTIDRASGLLYVAQQERYCRFKAGHPAGFIEAFANYYFDVADALQSHIAGQHAVENPHVFGTGMALEGMRLMEKIVESSKQNCWVEL